MSLENPNERSAAEKREAAYNIIIEDGMNVREIFAKGTGEILNNENIKNGRYNVNDGVIICNIDGNILALPYNDSTMELINAAELISDSSIGVPHLNDAEYMWGNEVEREGNSVFQEWKSIHQKYGNKIQ